MCDSVVLPGSWQRQILLCISACFCYFFVLDQTIRLADGTSPNEGRVEIFLKTEHAGEQIGEWGTICDDQWDLKDAAVICRMLNYTGALAAPLSGAYGEGSGTIWLDSVNCMGNETSIENCPHDGLGNHDCSHFEDAGVICQVNESHLPAYGEQ